MPDPLGPWEEAGKMLTMTCLSLTNALHIFIDLLKPQEHWVQHGGSRGPQGGVYLIKIFISYNISM